MSDPRAGTGGLGWVCRALFAGDDVRVSVPGEPPADGWRTVGRFAVVPDAARARFLLPVASARVTAASLLCFNALREPRTRALRWALGVAARTGAARLLPSLTVSIPSDVDGRDRYVVHHLAERLGGAELHAAIGVRPPDPHHKPTVQLFDPTGAPRGYAKIGWNGATRALVRTEAATLAALPSGAGFPFVPRLRYAGEWRDRSIAVIEPLPADVRAVPRPDDPYPTELLAVARNGGAATPPRPLRGSEFLIGLADGATGAVAAGCAEAGRAVRVAAALRARYGEVAVEFGHWHGDWVPWNLGTHRGRLVAWDWEHHAADVPVGFDLAHHGFQRALTLDGVPAAAATEAAAAALAGYGPVLGLDAGAQRAVLDCYLLELWLRTWRIADAGAGWNTLLHPHLLDVLADRLAQP
jgi:hypothetical protein